uniref:FXYD domain-containing ion transport regulator n=1 Tax=Astyanax mexicanus TaxID=7994 RepID=A0A3B1IZN6_ASTMX
MQYFSAPMVDNDADFVYDYETLRIAGLSIAAVIVVLSILLLTGNRIRRCGKSRVSSSPLSADVCALPQSCCRTTR